MKNLYKIRQHWDLSSLHLVSDGVQECLAQLSRNNSENHSYINHFFIDYFLANITFTDDLKVITKDMLSKLPGAFLCKGKKLTSYIRLYRAFSNIYILLNEPELHFFAKEYIYFKEFLFNNSLNNASNNVYTVISWIFFWFKPMFQIKCVSIPKKYKKKLKRKYAFVPGYIAPAKRESTTLKWMSYYVHEFDDGGIEGKLRLLFQDLFFNFKDSVLYMRKIKTYKKIFKLFIQKSS